MANVMFAHAARWKFAEEDRYTGERLVSDLQWLGYDHVIDKTNNGRTIENAHGSVVGAKDQLRGGGKRYQPVGRLPSTYDHQNKDQADFALNLHNRKMVTLKLRF